MAANPLPLPGGRRWGAPTIAGSMRSSGQFAEGLATGDSDIRARDLQPLPTGCARKSDAGELYAAGCGNLLPLPRFAEFERRAQPSQASVRASRRRRHLVVAANCTVDAINWMHGTPEASTAPPTPAQKSALKNVWKSTVATPVDPSISSFAAARQLLQLGRTYDRVQSTTTAPYEKGNVSLPPAGTRPVNIASVLHGAPHRFLKNFPDWLLKNDQDLIEAHDFASTIEPYKDPALRNTRNYQDFILELYRSGILTFTRHRKGRATPFFVKKSREHSAWSWIADRSTLSPRHLLDARWDPSPPCLS